MSLGASFFDRSISAASGFIAPLPGNAYARSVAKAQSQKRSAFSFPYLTTSFFFHLNKVPLKPAATRRSSKHLQRTGACRRWKQAIQFGKLGLRQKVIQRADIFLQSVATAGFRNDDHVVMRKQPCQAGLCGCHAVAPREINELRIRGK